MKSLVSRVNCRKIESHTFRQCTDVDVTNLQGTFQDAEPGRLILVVPNKRFVREILDGEKK